MNKRRLLWFRFGLYGCIIRPGKRRLGDLVASYLRIILAFVSQNIYRYWVSDYPLSENSLSRFLT